MPKANTSTGNLMISVFDGRRQPFSSSARLLIRVIDGNQDTQVNKFRKGPNIAVRNLPFFDNFGDDYTVLTSADKYNSAGFRPVKLLQNAWQHVDLMLLRKNAGFNFSLANWNTLAVSHPILSQLLAAGTDSGTAAKARYDDLLENRSETLAGFFNIATAMATILLPVGTPLDYLKELIWGDLAQNRFFAFADGELVAQVERAAAQRVFAPEFGSNLFHPGATRSYKQIQFGEANVQITFHENDTQTIGGLPCVKVELDMDYYRDIAAHALLEVLPNTLSGSLTDPKQVYVLRWMAGRHAGIPEFNPPYTIV